MNSTDVTIRRTGYVFSSHAVPEFRYVNDLAGAGAFLIEPSGPPDWNNVGTGTDVIICDLTETVVVVTGYQGKINWDTTKPDGTPRKLIDVSRLSALGWTARLALRDGLACTSASFLTEQTAGTLRSA